jgi:hypothetical protein
MAYQPKPNTGSLFANKEKKSPQSPDYQGDILIDLATLEASKGVVKVRIAGWKKQSASGLTYLSLAVDTFKPKSAQEQPRPRAASVADEQDDIPF